MLDCEYGCRDVVEALIKNGADISWMDAVGHDSYYYAWIGVNLDILTLLKTAVRSTVKESTLEERTIFATAEFDIRQDEANMKSSHEEHQNTQDWRLKVEIWKRGWEKFSKNKEYYWIKLMVYSYSWMR